MGLFSKKKSDKKGGSGSGGMFKKRRSKEAAVIVDDAKKAVAEAADDVGLVRPAQPPPPAAAAVPVPALKLPQSLPGEIHVSRNDSPGSQVSAMSRSAGFPPTPKGKGGRGGGRGTPLPLLPSLEAEADEEESMSMLFRSSGNSRRGPATKAKVKDVKETKKEKKGGSWFTRSKQFHDMVTWAFDTIDADKSGTVDKKELYTGLLMIHLKLATYAGPAACRPATREYVEKIFDKMDADNSGCLDRDEFMDVMSIVCSQVFTRVIIQWTMTLMIVPMIAQLIIAGLGKANDQAWDFWTGMDELDGLRASVGGVWDGVWGKASSLTPGFVKSGLGSVGGLWDKIPDGVKETLPVTLLSCVLGCIAVPYMLYKIDCFYEARAEKKAKETKAASANKAVSA